MSTLPQPAPSAPSWPHCGYGAEPATDPVGCLGVHVPGHTTCLAHLNDTDRDAYLAALTPGDDIDHRHTPFTAPLLRSLLQALHDPTADRPLMGAARFDGAQFSGAAWFDEVQFSSTARFGGAQFSGAAGFAGALFSDIARFDGAQFSDIAGFDGAEFSNAAWFGGAQFSDIAVFGGAQFLNAAWFGGAQFSGTAGFGGAQFSGAAWFDDAQFSGAAQFDRVQFSSTARFDETQFSSTVRFNDAQFSDIAGFAGAEFSNFVRFDWARFSGIARFDRVQFSSAACFDRAQFSSSAWFGEAQFSADSTFDGAQFSDDARFVGARFGATPVFGPVLCAKTVDLSGAVFVAPMTLEIAANAVRCERTRWESTATLRLRYAATDLSHAVLSFPVAVAAHPAPFTTHTGGGSVDESLLTGSDSGVRVVSVRGVDAAHLVLTDTDLRDCLFSGAFHLDQLRLEGRCTFAPTPTGMHRRHFIWPYRWTRRRTLAEEHHWRAQAAGQLCPHQDEAPSPRDWRTGPHHPDPDFTPDPDDVAALYRQLRKAFEDGKNEPGAADFYYGEMEMRRHDCTGTPPGERGLLWGYWLLSGYGLRASRALGWLLAAVTATTVLMMGLGLPDSSPKQVATGAVPAGGGRVTLTVDKPEPRLTLPVGDRFTQKRFDKAVQVVLNSVVFRSSGQDLTTWGTYTEMVSRFTEPVLLALAVLAMRSRIKR